MTYQETLDYLYCQLPMYQRQGAVAFKKDLVNILDLMEIQGNPHLKFKSIHIAGTNGKGTVAHMMAAGLQSNDLKVGLYTSPHYMDFRERIKINGTFISEADVVSFVEKYKDKFEELRPSFFEMTVAMAFQYFADQEVDIAIIETGLGGRLDSTNIINPILSVITNISLDHQAMLGDTLQMIAQEKAGIIKYNTPVIIGESQEAVSSIFYEKAKSMKSPIKWADRHGTLLKKGSNYIFKKDEEIWIENLEIQFNSRVQNKNLVTALYALFCMKDKLGLEASKIEHGIKVMADLTYYIGRFQVLNEKPLVIADSAHNVAGVSELLSSIKSKTYKNLHIVIGMVNDKDVGNVLTLLPKEASYYFAKADIPRGLDANILKEKAGKYCLMGLIYPSVQDAYEAAINLASEDDFVLIMGSVFVVAEVISSHQAL